MSDAPRNMKVLIAEDDPFSRQYFDTIVDVEGYERQTAKDGQEAIELFKAFDPDLVISDIQMPVVDGLELLEEIRRQKSDAIVIMATAFNSEDYAIKALQLGANNYLKKPIQSEDLKRTLRKYYSIFKSRRIQRDVISSIVKRSFTVRFQSDIELIPMIVDQLMREVEGIFEDNERVGIELGLSELITNSIEHGNLEISYQQKSAALDSNNLSELYTDRQSDPRFSSRQVHIEFEMDTECCQWTIIDEGNGFDWETVKNPLVEEGLLGLHGRGIFISRFQFDDLHYLGNGNTVVIRKKRSK